MRNRDFIVDVILYGPLFLTMAVSVIYSFIRLIKRMKEEL